VSELRVRLFGRFNVEVDGQVLEGFEVKKVQELFAYLLIYRDRPHPRETLAGILWDAQSTAQSKKYLRQALWQLQNVLQGLDENSPEPIIIVESDWIQINPNIRIRLDIEEMENAFKSTRGKRGRELAASQIDTLETANQLYHDDLLLGWYQDWCIFERERLQNMYITILDKLIGYFEAYGFYEDGIIYGTRILGFDRARERTHRSLMRLYFLADDRTGALRQYMRCKTALDEELNVAPAKKTEKLYALIVEDRPVSSFLLDNHSSSLEGAGIIIDLPQATTHLKRLQEMLIDVQHSVHQDIESIENALKNS
jgi:DNA-binding SARP family transcriptional activator